MNSPAELQPEADEAVSSAKLQQEADKEVSSAKFNPEGHKATSNEIPLPEANRVALTPQLQPVDDEVICLTKSNLEV